MFVRAVFGGRDGAVLPDGRRGNLVKGGWQQLPPAPTDGVMTRGVGSIPGGAVVVGRGVSVRGPGETPRPLGLLPEIPPRYSSVTLIHTEGKMHPPPPSAPEHASNSSKIQTKFYILNTVHDTI